LQRDRYFIKKEDLNSYNQMNKSTIFSSLSALGALTLSTQAATVTIPHTAFDGLNGLASGSITTTAIENGVTADITLTLTASAPGSTGTPPVTFQEGTRLGITSSFDQGNAPTTSINEGEILTIAVTSSVTSTAGVPLQPTHGPLQPLQLPPTLVELERKTMRHLMELASSIF